MKQEDMKRNNSSLHTRFPEVVESGTSEGHFREFPKACFSNVLVTFRARKTVLCLPCLHSRSKFQ